MNQLFESYAGLEWEEAKRKLEAEQILFAIETGLSGKWPSLLNLMGLTRG